uniref:Uncharacterized protein n=1 Tax=Rangifer tarandus platyrhynchus TaxID=3082113 RepID=A0ACB0F778_RANTA|nr:unnamed protein product [Rangifer tarandus platyrhynchus]
MAGSRGGEGAVEAPRCTNSAAFAAEFIVRERTWKTNDSAVRHAELPTNSPEVAADLGEQDSFYRKPRAEEMNADTETRALTSGLLGGNLICLSPLLSSTAHRYQSPVLGACARAELAGR